MLRARKRFGQNFLTDANIIDRIIGAVNPRSTDQVLEIGPGRGALTDQLVKHDCQLTVVEIDRDLVQILHARYPDLSIISADVLKTDLEQLVPTGGVRIVGNLPYNISTPLLFKLFASNLKIIDMHFMLQLEVVDRMAAPCGTSDYGRLSIMTQLACDAEKLFEVPPSAFTPSPKVTSAIVRLSPKPPSPVNLQLMELVVAHAFSMRRKTVTNALRRFLTATQLESLGIDPSTRPEQLNIDDYVRCVGEIERTGSGTAV